MKFNQKQELSVDNEAVNLYSMSVFKDNLFTQQRIFKPFENS